MVKFICKELFLYVYAKQIDNLRTNHRVSRLLPLSRNCFFKTQHHNVSILKPLRILIFLVLEYAGDIRITSKRASTLDPTLNGSGPCSRSREHKDRELRLERYSPAEPNSDVSTGILLSVVSGISCSDDPGSAGEIRLERDGYSGK